MKLSDKKPLGMSLLARDPTQIRTLIIMVFILQTITISILWAGLRPGFWTYVSVALFYLLNIGAYLCYYFFSPAVSAVFLVFALWSSIALCVFFPISDDDLGLGYLIAGIVLAFVLLDRFWGLLITILSSFVLVALISLRQANLLPFPAYPDIYSWRALFNELIIYWFIAIMLWVVMGHLKQANRESADAIQALSDKTALLELITSNVPANITYVDSNERYIFANSQFVSSISRFDNPIGKRRSEVLPRWILRHTQGYNERAWQGENIQFELKHENNGKVEVITEILYAPQINNGVVEGMIALSTDVTQTRRTEFALYEAQRAESLGVVAGGIAHDFNNLLSAMLGQATLAKMKLAPDHPAQNHLEKNIAATKRASQLTKQMLAYSGRGNFEKREFDMNDLLRDNVDLLRVSIPKTITLHIQPTQKPLYINADLAQMQQVIMNLLLNAAQAMEGEYGNIWLETKLVTLKREQLFGTQTLAAGSYVCCVVRDDGCGMSQDVQSRIFEPFYTTKDNGSGLGLAAVSGIVYGHEGSLRVTSTEGVGTVFELILPLIESQTEQEEPVDVTNRLIRGGTVLLIDDEQIIADAVGDILSMHDICMMYAAHGEAGIACYEANRDEIDAVLLDLTMPGMSGVEVFHELRAINPNVPIVISSGYSRNAAAQEIIDGGSADFLPKPYDISDLLQTLCRYLPKCV